MSSGLCILTGETGSGKSILLDALGLAIGYRSNNRLLRKGASEGLVVAEFDIENNNFCKEILIDNGLKNFENSNILTLRRVLKNGTSKAFVNDILVGVNLLNQIGSSLVEIHGQHEQSNLLNATFHRITLDKYSQNEDILLAVRKLFEELKEVNAKLNQLSEEKSRNDREKDYLQHIIKELDRADIKVGEEDELIDKKNLLISKEKVCSLIAEVLTQINDSDGSMSNTQRSLIRSQNLDLNGKLSKVCDILDEVSSKFEEVRGILDGMIDSFDLEIISLEEIEERLFLIRNLSRKFNIAPNELSDFLDDAKKKLHVIENFDILSSDLEIKRGVLKEKYLERSMVLRKAREGAAKKLNNAVEKELSFLKMSSVKFCAIVDNVSEENYSVNGVDKVRFAAKTNSSSNLDDITKIASGGELSRFMLALKVALLEIKSVPILIFDEIDSGIGGAVADAVGERLKLLSQEMQIMVVTHHPQIAAKSDYHLMVKKTTKGGVETNTEIEILNKDQKEIEVARMLSGENISDEAIAAAKSLIENS